MRPLDAIRKFIYGRRLDYVQTFTSEPGRRVLEDLSTFCRANDTTFHTDPRLSALQEGRREVWLRIQNHLNLSPEELYTLATGRVNQPKGITTEEDDDV